MEVAWLLVVVCVSVCCIYVYGVLMFACIVVVLFEGACACVVCFACCMSFASARNE